MIGRVTKACREWIPLVSLCMTLWHAPGESRGEERPTPRRVSDLRFNEEVLPILEAHCFECHSHFTKKAQGGLVLDSRTGWATGGESGPAIVPGKPNKSLLISAVRYEGHEMPPKGKLPNELIKRLEQWVADGAHDPRVTKSKVGRKQVDLETGRQHWAFRPLVNQPPPMTKDRAWPTSDVDRFVLAKLEATDLKPVVNADRYTWLRRVTFDVTGVPPTIEQIREFAADKSSDAQAKVVDRLLASRSFGERWARHWLDLVGYADQIGTSNNIFAQHAWRYRDYVIEAFNNDKPFDRLIREQIAGDLLPYQSVEERAANLVATGFLVLGDIEIVEADKAKLLVDIVDQQVNKVGKAFLGMTLECARCHDHKFDPVPQRDYYALGGFFHGTSTVYKTERGVWSDVNVIELPETEAQRAERARKSTAHGQKLAALKRERKQAEGRRAELDKLLKDKTLPKDKREQFTKERAQQNGRIGPLNTQIVHAEFFTPVVPRTYGVKDFVDPQDMRITIRGNPRALGAEVPRGFLQVATVSKSAKAQVPQNQSGRRQLADWIANADNPLTARVAVNRIWQKLFGEGLVRSVDYFGLPGDRPTHPQLLDHVAAQFMRDGWSVKRLVRRLVLSRTYGLASAHSDAGHAADPENRLLWRMQRRRLDAEAIRDAMLLVSGQLKVSSGGPALPLEFPENVSNIDPKNVNPPSFRLSKWRPGQEFERTIYLPVIRSSAQPGPATLRNVFDFPQPSQFTGHRSTTAVPTQALFLMNSAVVKKHAAAVAARLQAAEKDERTRLKLVWLMLLNRPINAEEFVESTAFLKAGGTAAWNELCHALLASNEFLMRL